MLLYCTPYITIDMVLPAIPNQNFIGHTALTRMIFPGNMNIWGVRRECQQEKYINNLLLYYKLQNVETHGNLSCTI